MSKFLEFRHPSEVEKNGCTLDQLASMFAVPDVPVQSTFGDAVTVDGLRTMLVDASGSEARGVIVDFSRKVLDQKGVRHPSPLAAYNRTADMFLVPDMARKRAGQHAKGPR